MELSDVENRRWLGLIDCSFRQDVALPIFFRPPSSTTLASENRGFLLLIQPLEKFLETGVGQNGFHRVERVAKFVVTPGLVNEILARVARRHNFGPAFAARNHMMSTRRYFSFIEQARLGHKSSLQS